MNITAPMYSHNLTKANTRQPERSFQPDATGQNVPSSPAIAAEQVTFAAKSTPVQFSVSMLLALMNAQPENQQPGGTSVTVSSDQVPLQLEEVDATDAAQQIMDLAGSGGELNLSSVEQLLGITKPERGEFSPKAVIERDWNSLTGGSDTLSTSQLAAAIKHLSGAHLQPADHGDQIVDTSVLQPIPSRLGGNSARPPY
ncbi:hypothetical protein ACI7BZ_10465 [Xanthobacter sp. AM11]|uniref:hypothetical protein n=1 Tax=Xanthobacter sp. AM11 TaxID=3380643 RepID=UPI0039BF8375